MRRPRHGATVIALALLAGARTAHPFTTRTSGTQLVAQYFPVLYKPPPGQLWGVDTNLVFVSRAIISKGTLEHTATLQSNDVPRAAQGAGSVQTIVLRNTAGNTILASATGPPSETLVASYSVPWDKEATIFSYPLFLAFDVEVTGIPAMCGTSGAGCTMRYTDIILPSRAAIAIEGVELPRPTLLLRGTRYFDLKSAGLSPFAEWVSLGLDGTELTKIPFLDGYGTPPARQWYRHPVRAGDPTKSGDPLPPSGVEVPSQNGIEAFLSCGGGGCGTHAARIGLGDGAIPTGLHTITLATQPYAGRSFKFFGETASVGSGDAGDPALLSTSFILFGPLVEVEPAEAGPGQRIVVRGSGFAPNSQVRLAALLAGSSRNASLGSQPTDVTGGFTAERTLPSAGDPFFADVLARGPQPGYVRADVDDAQFLADYFGGLPQYHDATVRFLPTAVGPVGSTTTTTLPGGGTTPGGLDVPACTNTPVPAKAEAKFDKAAALVDDVEQLILEQAAKRKVKRLIGKAQGALQRARGLVNRAKKKGLVSAGCADTAFGVIDELASTAQALRDGLQ